MNAIDFFDLATVETPRQILEADFPSIAPLPIRGGWGYDRATACIIDRNDPALPTSGFFDGAEYEHLFAQYRVFEELIVFRPPGERYAGIRLELESQQLAGFEGRHFDVLSFRVEAFREADFERLKAIYEGPDGASSPDFDHEAHMRLHESLKRTALREYWFDITSFFGR